MAGRKAKRDEGITLSPEELAGAQPAAGGGIDLSPEELAGAAPAGGQEFGPGMFQRAPGPWADDYVQEDPRQARIRRGTAAGQTASPTFLQKLGSAAFGQDIEAPPWKQKPDLGARFVSFLSGGARTPEQLRDQLGKVYEDQPELYALKNATDTARLLPAAALTGAGATAAATTAARTLPTLGRFAAGIGDIAGGAAAGGGTAIAQGKGPGDIAKDAAGGALASAFVGKGLRAIGGPAGRGAEAIKQSDTTTGKDIRLLEKHGYEPSPVPFQPVARIEEPPPVGPAAPRSPSKMFGVQATSEGRGLVGTQSGDALKNELAMQRKGSFARTKAGERRINRPGAEGEREISVEPLIKQAEAEAQSVDAKVLPGIEPGVKRLQSMLEGRVEPSAEIYASEAFPYKNRPGVANVEVPELDPNYGVHSRVPYDPRPAPERPVSLLGDPRRPQPPEPVPMYNAGRRMEQPPTGPQEEIFTPLNRRVQSIPEDVTAHGGTTAQSGFQEGAEPMRVGLGVLDSEGRAVGDIHGRTGEQPNRVQTARNLNRIRDAMDAAGRVAEKEGLTKKDLPFARLSDTARGMLTEHAPETARMNRRAHARLNRVERAEELMKDAGNPAPEALGMQLAGQGESGSKVSGARTPRLEQLRREFPVSSRMNRAEVGRLMDNPPLLLAEERLQLKKLPRIGGGGTDAFNLAEPVIGRGVYPGLRGAEETARRLGRYPFAPGLLGQLQRAQEEENKRRARR